MFWNRPPSEPEPVLARPEFVESQDTEREVVSMGRGIALVGLPDSGKSSFLFALRHAPERPTLLRWIWPSSSLELARMTVQPGALLPATDPGVFETSNLRIFHRKWRRPPSKPSRWLMPFLRPSRRVVVPEVSGEHVRDFSSGKNVDSLADSRRQVFRDFATFLESADEVLFLAGLRNSYQVGAMRQESVEAAMVEAVSCLDAIVGHIRSSPRRGRHAPIFVTFLVTKRDAVGDVPGLDGIRVPVADSAAYPRAQAAWGPEEADRMFRTDGDGYVSFGLNRSCDRAAADIGLQEAIAVDFLACHAPKAAAALAGLAQQPGVSLRVLTGKPFGYECRTADNRSAAPSPGRLHSSMVWEVLDDLIERSFRWRVRRGVRTLGVVAAALVLAAFLVGPAFAWLCRAKADAATVGREVEVARSWLLLDDLNPWSMLERWSSDAHRRADAERWRDLREVAAPMATDAVKAELDEQVHARDPFGDLAGPAVRDRNVSRLLKFIELHPSLTDDGTERRALQTALSGAAHLRLDRAEAYRLARAAQDLRGKGPFAAITGTTGWRTVASRLRTAAGWIGPGDRDMPAIVPAGLDGVETEALRSELLRSALAADVRAQIANLPPGTEAVLDLATAARLAEDAARADDRDSMQRIDDLVRRSVQANWKRSMGNGAAAGAVFPDIGAAFGKDALQWPFADFVRREFALQTLREGLGRLASALRDGSADVHFGEEAVRLDAAVNALGVASDLNPEQLRRLLDLLKGAERRSQILKTAVEPTGQLPTDQDIALFGCRSTRGADSKVEMSVGLGLDPDSMTFDFSASHDRMACTLRGLLERRLEERARSLLRDECKAQDIEAVRSALYTVCCGGGDGYEVPWLPALLRADRVACGNETGAREAISKFAADRFLRPLLPQLFERYGKADRVATIGWESLSAVEQAPGLTSEDRRRAADALLRSIPAATWESGGTADQGRWKEQVLREAGKCGSNVSEFAVDKLQRALADALRDPGNRDRCDAAIMWRRMVSRVSAGLPLTDRFGAALGELVRELAVKDLRTDRKPGPVEALLKEVFGEQGGSFALIEKVLQDVEEQRRLVEDFDLLAVRDPKSAQIRFYLGRMELDRDRLLGKVPLHVLEPDCASCIGLGLEESKRAARALHPMLRLPTVIEWDEVRSHVLRSGKSDPEAVVKDRLFERASNDKLGTKSTAKGSILEEGKDVAQPPGSLARFVGLLFGVREWCEDSKERPRGLSYLDVDDAPRDVEQRKMSDVGFRLALDPIPSSVRPFAASAAGP